MPQNDPSNVFMSSENQRDLNGDPKQTELTVKGKLPAMIECQESDLLSHLKQLENMIKYKKEQCSDNGQEAIETVTLERREMSKVSTSTVPAHCLERMSTPQHRQGEPQQTSVVSER